MQLDLKKRPLGQYLSRHLLFEEWDPQGKGWAKGLYLALAQETTSMFASTVDRSAGFIRLEPTVNGAAVFQPPFVKSGIFCGIEPERTDRSERSTMQLHVAVSYTSMGGGVRFWRLSIHARNTR